MTCKSNCSTPIPNKVLSVLAVFVLGGTMVESARAQMPPVESSRQHFYLAGFGEHTDNLNRLYDNKTGAMIYGVGAGFDLNSTSGRVQGRLQGDLAYADSSEASYKSGLLGNIIGRGMFVAIPNRFNWIAEAAYGKVPVDQRLADTTINRQDFSSLKTGPELTVPLSTRDVLRTSAGYSITNYGVSLDDYDRTDAEVALQHSLTPSQTLSLSAAASRIGYKRTDLFSDFDQRRAFIEWNARGAKTNLVVQAGYDGLRDKTSQSGGNLFNVRVTRKVGQLSVLIFQVDQQLTDASSAFSRRLDFVGTGGGGVNISPAAGLSKTKSGRVFFKTAARQLEVEINSTYEQNRFVNADLMTANDRNMILSSVSVFKSFTPSFAVGVFGDLTNADYVKQAFKYTEWDGGLVLSYRLSQAYGVQLSGSHSRRTGGLAAGGFSENVARLGLYYAMGATPLDMRERPGRR